MNPQKTNRLLQDLKEEVGRLETAAATAQRRLDIAKTEADSLEDRNHRALELIEKEVEAKKEQIVNTAKKEAEKLRKEIKSLEKTKLLLQESIDSINKDKEQLSKDLESLQDEKTLLADDLLKIKDELNDVNEVLITSTAELKDKQGKITNLENQIAVMEQTRQDINEDIDVLGGEADELENKIIDLDTTYKARKETFDKQLKDTHNKLQNVLIQLAEAQNKDKSIRQAWADKELDLEKRTQAVRKLEAKVSDSEKRVAELDSYLKL